MHRKFDRKTCSLLHSTSNRSLTFHCDAFFQKLSVLIGAVAGDSDWLNFIGLIQAAARSLRLEAHDGEHYPISNEPASDGGQTTEHLRMELMEEKARKEEVDVLNDGMLRGKQVVLWRVKKAETDEHQCSAPFVRTLCFIKKPESFRKKRIGRRKHYHVGADRNWNGTSKNFRVTTHVARYVIPRPAAGRLPADIFLKQKDSI